MPAYILIALMYVGSAHSAGSITTAEFADERSCVQAARAAKEKFDGWASTLYFVCVPKGSR
ncbi:hypothetical protein HU675_0038420 [Bradyrhizobium septentrionale]|uniref:hypothetical protein n=1 Tax=Bradyrhizobium septentrionale TaxID=1404411 RepID=UPI0015963F4B|nr:hypothetical protein [Bradyrhizobium septentrionale]UGY23763.1 hypothetical protein HU675_0038420 [Bradyrhizobium septentrionale]